MDKVHEALSKLDAQNDNHWTQDGLPRLDTIRILLGDPSLTREALTAAAPEFNRTAALAAAQATPTGGATGVQGGDEGAAQGANGAAVAGDSNPPPPPLFNPPVLAEEPTDQGELEAAIEAARIHLSDRLDNLQLAKQELNDAQNELAALEAKLEEAKNAGVHVISEYHARQRQLLEERAARQQLIKDSGLNLRELANNLKSPIDTAMSRNNRRGGARPKKV